MTQSKPTFRTVDVALTAPFEGWTATLRAEGVPARVMIDLGSGSVERAMHAVEKLILKHNFLDDNGEPTTSVLDAPMDALSQVVERWSEAVTALPPR